VVYTDNMHYYTNTLIAKTLIPAN